MPKKRGNPTDARLMCEARDRLGLSQPEMGELLGLSQGSVSQIENEWTPIGVLVRRELARLLARADAEQMRASATSVWLYRMPSCMNAHASLSEWAAHTETCPNCLAYLYPQPNNER